MPPSLSGPFVNKLLHLSSPVPEMSKTDTVEGICHAEFGNLVQNPRGNEDRSSINFFLNLIVHEVQFKS